MSSNHFSMVKIWLFIIIQFQTLPFYFNGWKSISFQVQLSEHPISKGHRLRQWDPVHRRHHTWMGQWWRREGLGLGCGQRKSSCAGRRSGHVVSWRGWVGGWVRVGLSWGWVGVGFSMNGIKVFGFFWGSGYLGYVDSNQGYNLYKWVKYVP